MISINENLHKLTPSAIRTYTALANATPGCIKFTIGEPDFDTPAAIRQAAVDALWQGKTHYAPNAGEQGLRKAIAEFETAKGTVCTEDQVILTVGATEALLTAFLGILNPGEEIVIPTPAFPLYDSLAIIAGATPVHLDLTAADFEITEEALSRVITSRTKAILLNSPNNPTGTVLSRGSLDAVKRAVQQTPMYVICDNVYDRLSYGELPDLSTDPDIRDRLILCQSFSKPYAMTGWRVGYTVVPKEIAPTLLLLHAAQVSSLPPFVQSACLEALRTDVTPMQEIFRRRRDYLLSRLDAMGLTYPAPMGAFYVFADIRKYGMDSGTFCTRMIREAGVAAVPGSCFFGEGYIRLSYSCSDSDLKEGLDRMEAFLKTL